LAASDGTLVLATLNGDKSAFGKLYDRYAGLVRAICYDNTGDLSGAQDLAQEVFLRAYEKLNTVEQPDRFGAWLVSITRNVCREYRRGRFRDRHRLVGLAPEQAETNTFLQQDGHVEQLKEAMGRLTERERLALHVYYLQDQDAKRSQEILGISRSGLYRLLDRARKKLEKYIKQTDTNG